MQRGSPGNDTFTINSDRNFLYGIDGQDTFNGSTQSSMLDGGAGTDNFNMTDSSFNLVLGGADAAGDQIFFSGIAKQRVRGRRRQRLDRHAGWRRLGNVLNGGDGDDFLGSSGGSNTLVGGAGNDILQTNGGGCTLLGGDGNDQLQMTDAVLGRVDGGEGDDQIVVGLSGGGTRPLYVSGGDGNDSLYMQSAGRAVLLGGNGNDWLGTNGTQTCWWAATAMIFSARAAARPRSQAVPATTRCSRSAAPTPWTAATATTSSASAATQCAGRRRRQRLCRRHRQQQRPRRRLRQRHVGGGGRPYHRSLHLHAGYGQDQIIGFVPGAAGTDVINIRGFGLANFAALQPFISQSGADTVITLNGSDILTLKNINSGTLVDDDFQFV